MTLRDKIQNRKISPFKEEADAIRQKWAHAFALRLKEAEAVLHEYLSEEELERTKIDSQFLCEAIQHVAESLSIKNFEVPPTFQADTKCKRCGVMPSYGNSKVIEEVQACPWCFISPAIHGPEAELLEKSFLPEKYAKQV